MTNKVMEGRDKIVKKAKKMLNQIDKLIEEYKALTTEEKKSFSASLRKFMGDTTDGK